LVCSAERSETGNFSSISAFCMGCSIRRFPTSFHEPIRWDVDYPPKTEPTDAEVADTKTVPVASPEDISAGTVRTERLSASKPQDIARAAAILRSGGIVAFPTETVYGLGANALDAAAVEKIFLAKQRPHWDPLIVHISDREDIACVAELDLDFSGRTKVLIERFWPGPLTLLLPRTQAIPDAVTAGRPLVGVRMPDHPVAQNLIHQAGVPIAAPSANRFGHTSPTSAQHVLDDLEGRIDAVLDGGSCTVGVESTVLDPTQWPMVVYREGKVTQERIMRWSGKQSVVAFVAGASDAEPESLPSPGVGLRHYAPNARLVLIFRDPEVFDPRNSLLEIIRDLSVSETVGILLPDGWNSEGAAYFFNWGIWRHPDELARNLFAGLRALDDLGVTVIVAPIPNGPGIAAAIRDRLEKAARTR
jgi:L-threonylcarbamoyladenylate synthase